MAQWSWEAAGAGPEAGLEAGLVAGTVEAMGPGPRSRPRRSSGSGCEVEAVAVEAGGRKEGEGRSRSLLAQLLTGCPAGAEGARCRAGPESSGRNDRCGGKGARCSKERQKVKEMWVAGAKKK